MDDLLFPLPEAKFKNEAKFTSWFGSQIRKKWWHRHKISDMDIRLKPYDGVLALNSNLVAVEVKVSDNKKKIDLIKKLRPNQIQGLSEVFNTWWTSIILYYNNFIHKYKAVRYIWQKEIILNIHTGEGLPSLQLA